jgi:hypothetical protein
MTAGLTGSFLNKISCCEVCNEEAIEVIIWIDRKMELPKGNQYEYSETLELCEQHAIKVLEALLEYPKLKNNEDRGRVSRLLSKLFTERRKNDPSSSNSRLYRQ